ncbi:MAG TPA: precorrin-3B C(17)-methyltransferase [Propylenella sp.]
MKPVFVALTSAGLATACRARAALGGEVHALSPAAGQSVGPPDATFAEAAGHLRALFIDGRPIVGICASGILIRILAPLLADKRDEPPVIAVSEDGGSIVPLLGGHRGANDLARALAAALGGHAAITTAGDSRFGVALDAPPAGWTLANPQDAKSAMAALLMGASGTIEGRASWLEESGLPLDDGGEVRLVATTRRLAGDARTLVYHPRRLAVGLGSERGADPAEAIALLSDTLRDAGLAPQSVALVGSLDLKADEPAILAAAHHLGVPARFFSADTLEAEAPRLQNPSEAVFREVGCHGVAEGAALSAAGPGGALVVGKRKSARVTCAIAEAADVIDPLSVGRARGRLAVVGIGPGAEEWLTPQARRLLETSDAAVGYSLYLDLVAPLIAAAERIDSPLGSEADRARTALALAAEGRSVALVSSGDAGIYAMAALVFESLDSPDLPEGAARAEIVVAPGISAMQAAAARAGAPLGHDFCAISLSDLLTPWETIEARLRAAAAGDFVVALYNPVSQRRRTQLAAAKKILLMHRPPDTPVVLARDLGRAGERVTTIALSELEPEMADMLTLVLVGSSTTRRVEAAGRLWTYTPRGYQQKPSPPCGERVAGPSDRLGEGSSTQRSAPGSPSPSRSAATPSPQGGGG